MADFDFLDGFDTGGDWGFTGVSSKPSDTTVASSKATADVVKQTADGVGKAVSSEIIGRLETKLKSQMDDEYDLRKDNLGKIQKDKFDKLEKLIIPLLIKLAKSPEAYIHWPNRAEVIEAQLKKIVAITRA